MDLVRIGFIGLGNITQTRHLPAIQRIGGAKVAGGADINKALLTQVAARNEFELTFTDYRDLIAHDGIDAVFVNLPTYLHAEVTMAALRAGKHVFCEKPFAMNSRQAADMLAVARESGRSLMISNVQRYAMRSRKLKEQIDSGTLGDVYYIKAGILQRNSEPPRMSWFSRREKAGGGVLMDQGPGLLDLLLWLVDFPEVCNISGYTGRHVISDDYDVEDFAAISFRAGGVTCHVDLAWAHSFGPHENLLYTDVFAGAGGARCRASWSKDGPPLTVFRRGERDMISEHVVGFTPVDAHHAQDKHFIDSIRAEREPGNTPEQALAVMKIIEQVYAQNNTAMTAPAPAEQEPADLESTPNPPG